MPRYIVKLEDRYFEWSTVVDAPVTYPMTLEQFEAYYREEYGRVGMEQLPERLERVERQGTSARGYETPGRSCVEGLLACNRAGPRETCLTLDELRDWARRETYT